MGEQNPDGPYIVKDSDSTETADDGSTETADDFPHGVVSGRATGNSEDTDNAEEEPDLETQYQVVLHHSTESRHLVKFKSDWVVDREVAQELASKFTPTGDGWGELFEVEIRKRTVIASSDDTSSDI